VLVEVLEESVITGLVFGERNNKGGERNHYVIFFQKKIISLLSTKKNKTLWIQKIQKNLLCGRSLTLFPTLNVFPSSIKSNLFNILYVHPIIHPITHPITHPIIHP
jgi:hypothetical protein